MNLEAIAECALPQTYMEVCAFLSLMGNYRRFTKGFTCIVQPLSKYLTGEGASRKSEQVSLTEDALKAFEALKQACMTAPIFWLLLTTLNHSCWRPMHPRMDWGDGQYHPTAYGSRALTPHEKNYHSTKVMFLAMKWAVMEHFKEYLPYQYFLERMDNNLLTYIMSTPNLDAMVH